MVPPPNAKAVAGAEGVGITGAGAISVGAAGVAAAELPKVKAGLGLLSVGAAGAGAAAPNAKPATPVEGLSLAGGAAVPKENGAGLGAAVLGCEVPKEKGLIAGAFFSSGAAGADEVAGAPNVNDGVEDEDGGGISELAAVPPGFESMVAPPNTKDGAEALAPVVEAASGAAVSLTAVGAPNMNAPEVAAAGPAVPEVLFVGAAPLLAKTTGAALGASGAAGPAACEPKIGTPVPGPPCPPKAKPADGAGALSPPS